MRSKAVTGGVEVAPTAIRRVRQGHACLSEFLLGIDLCFCANELVMYAYYELSLNMALSEPQTQRQSKVMTI